jgi:hypothetical protein
MDDVEHVIIGEKKLLFYQNRDAHTLDLHIPLMMIMDDDNGNR